MQKIESWADFIDITNTNFDDKLAIIPDNLLYRSRLDFELQEIDKQGANLYWIELVSSGRKFKSNPGMLLLPWLFDLVDQDPIANRSEPLLCTVNAAKVKQHQKEHGGIPSDIIKDPDMPDIDLDCLPESRDPIKAYAMRKYGAESVCSVGTWQTYKFKSAIMDTFKALGEADPSIVHMMTKDLGDDADALKDGGFAICKGKTINAQTGIDKECGFVHDGVQCPKCLQTDTDAPTIGKLIADYPQLASFRNQYPQVIEYAVKLVGRVRNMGMHAGALIVADRALYGNIPMAKSGKHGYWISMWTEGRNTQLSKFGYCKWDILGLKTHEYIVKCSKLIEKNRGISFGKNMEGWDDINPHENRAASYHDGNGNKRYVDLNDPHALALANAQKTDAVFQFDTELAKSFLAHGVKSFYDLMLINAMGHPGPMACCWSHSKINTDNGMIMIKDLNNDDKIKCLSNNGDIISTNKYKVVRSGAKKLLRVTLKNGKTIVVTHEHRVLTDNGYIQAGFLAIGQNVAVCKQSD